MSSDLLREIKRKERFRFYLYYGLLSIFMYHGVLGFIRGKNGWNEAKELDVYIGLYQQKAEKLRSKIEHVKAEIIAYNNDLFRIEQYARQNLQMAKADEKLFFCNRS